MKSFRVKDGDISLTLGDQAEAVYGGDKLQQDLKLWLMEPYGTGFTTPLFGSNLGEMIGEINSDYMKSKVVAEVQRILGLYQKSQLQKIQLAQKNGLLYLWSKAEILQSVDQVSVGASSDLIQVRVSISTLSSQPTTQQQTLTFSLTTGGLVLAA